MKVRIKSYTVHPRHLKDTSRFARRHVQAVTENGVERWAEFEIRNIHMDTSGYVPVAKKYHYERVA